MERPFSSGGDGPFRVPGTRLAKKVKGVRSFQTKPDMTNGISEMVPAEESRGFARSAFVFCFRSCRYPPDGNERAIKVMLEDQQGTHARS